MKKSVKILIIVAVIVAVVGMIAAIYNKMVKLDENVQQAWAQVENVYQRRADLIPNLVKTVQGAAEFEKSTLEAVINARANATSVQVDPTKLTPESIAEFQKAQDQLSSALGRLLVVKEQYPELKANQNFLDLQTQLEGTENRITVERKNFNDVVMNYNSTIRKFPNVLFAGMFGFDKKGYFQAKEGAENAPEVEFNFE
ncbi:MAG: LemA family protein [Bacteroidales bacterium]|nr:LemA family protein [Bacteroidales bacterium]